MPICGRCKQPWKTAHKNCRTKERGLVIKPQPSCAARQAAPEPSGPARHKEWTKAMRKVDTHVAKCRRCHKRLLSPGVVVPGFDPYQPCRVARELMLDEDKAMAEFFTD